MACIIIRKSRIFAILNIIIALTVAVSLGITVVAKELSDSHGEVPVSSIEMNENAVMLTVNVYEYTDADALLESFVDTKATFFISEAFQEKYPEKVKKIVEKGHSIGILEDDIKALSCNEIYDRLAVRIERMARIINKNIDIVRFESGGYDENCIKAVYSVGLLPAHWSADDTEKDFSKGDIILIKNEKNIDSLIKKITADGLEIKTIDSLIHRNAYVVDFRGRQSAS